MRGKKKEEKKNHLPRGLGGALGPFHHIFPYCQSSRWGGKGGSGDEKRFVEVTNYILCNDRSSRKKEKEKEKEEKEKEKEKGKGKKKTTTVPCSKLRALHRTLSGVV